MKFTDETLCGVIYYHRENPKEHFTIIKSYDEIERKCVHNESEIATHSNGQSYNWFNVNCANRWFANGTWVLVSKPEIIVNNYEIY